MTKSRLEAFSDGVLAIIITIMVLELKVPEGSSLDTLKPLVPKLVSYILSFLYVGIYWNNHHHLFQAVQKINGKILWANLLLLFSLSLIPFTTAWMGENHFAKDTVILYGINLLFCALAYFIIEKTTLQNEGKNSKLAKALGNKTKEYISIVLYVVGILMGKLYPIVSIACYFMVALMWLIPDKRIEKEL